VNRRRRAVVVLLLGASATTGCVAPSSFASELVACTAGKEATPANGVLLMAQSVPTSTWVPCLEGLPVGWQVSELAARNGSATFWLHSDRHGEKAVEVQLTEACSTEGASEIPSDREGMRRLEQVTEVSPRYVGRRFYVFDGGCITVLFTITGEDRSEPLGVVTQGLGAVPREELRDLVRERSGGRLELDPIDGGRP
jgi:hypothetical protein